MDFHLKDFASSHLSTLILVLNPTFLFALKLNTILNILCHSDESGKCCLVQVIELFWNIYTSATKMKKKYRAMKDMEQTLSILKHSKACRMNEWVGDCTVHRQSAVQYMANWLGSWHPLFMKFALNKSIGVACFTVSFVACNQAIPFTSADLTLFKLGAQSNGSDIDQCQMK